MSTTIDEKVVEMRFDNKNFESNVNTTLSALDKLKQKLNFSGASKGLESVNAAAKNVNMSGLASSVETVSAKFSALQVIGVTALANIANSVTNAGKNIVSALTIDPVMAGFREYETQINSIQTILANTQKEGTNISQVNAALDTLNAYADKTIYNFTEMTRNIGTFTAAGVKLQTSVDSIQGIANLAAISGSTSQQASTAMYQLSQAIASGTVKLMDWNSVVNAGMGGQVFQDALIRTSEHLKTGAKAAIAAKGSFRESLQTGWLTTQVLTETLKQFSLNVDTAEDYEKAMRDLVAQGYTKEEAKNIVDMAKTAGEAATKVKTFSQLIDTLKEALGSGWAQTWRTVIGDFNEARELFTGISDFLSGIINASSNARNSMLKSALGRNFSDLAKNLSNIVEPAKKAVDTVKNVGESISDLGNIVDDVILGKFGNGEDRFNALTKAGKNYYEVQNKVNEKLGNSFRYTDAQIAAQNKLLGIQKQSNETVSKAKGETKKLTDAQKEQIKQLAKLSDEQLRSKGYTDKQIAAFQELRDTASKLGIPLDEFIDNIDKINGRWLLLDSLKNFASPLVQTFKAISSAFTEIFDPYNADRLFNIIGGIHKLSSYFAMNDEAADKLKRTFKGLFAIINIVTTFAGGAFSTAFKVLTAVLDAFDLDILTVTATIGDMLVGFRDFILNNEIITNSIELLAQGIKFLVDRIKEWYDAFVQLPQVQAVIERIRTAFNDLSKAFNDAVDSFKNGETSIGDILLNLGNAISNAFSKLFEGFSLDKVFQTLSFIGDGIRGFFSNLSFIDVGTDIVDGLVNGLKNGSRGAIETIISIGSELLNGIKALLGIHSPSTEFFEIGENIVEGLINGLKSMFESLLSFVKSVGQGIIDAFNKIDFGVVLTSIIGVGTFAVFYKTVKALDKFGDAAKNLTSPLKSVSGLFDALKGSIVKLSDAVSTKIKAEAFKSIAISIGILAGAIFVLCQLDIVKVWNAVGVIAVLSGVLAALSYALTKFGGEINGFDSAKLAATLLSVGTALLLFAAVMKIISSMSWEDLGKAAAGIAGMGLVTGALVAITKNAGTENQIEQASKMIKKIAGAFLLMTIVAKIIATMSWGDLGKAAAGIAGLTVIIGALVAITKNAGTENQIKQAAAMIKKIAGALLLMTVVAKIIATMSWGDLGKAAAGIAGLSAIIVWLVEATKVVGDKEIASIGKTIFAVAGAMFMLVAVGKLIATMSWGDLVKAAVGIAGLSAIVIGLVEATKVAGDKEIAKIGSTILAVGGAIMLLAITAKIIAGMSWGAMIKAVVGITALGAIVAGLVEATKIAGDKEIAKVGVTLLAMAGAIAILAGVCVILGLVKPATLVKGIAAVAALSVLVDFMVAATKDAKDVKGTMIGIAIAIGVMAGALVVLSLIEPAPLFKAVTALSIVMGMFALVEKMSGSVTGSFKTLIVMTAAIGLIAGALALLSILPTDGSLQNAVAVSTILLALAASCKILDGVSDISKSALKSMAILLGVIAGIAVILGVMSALNVKASLPNVLALSVMLISMSAACAILGTIANVSDSAMIAMGVLTGIVAALAVILGIMSALNVKASLPNVIALSVMLLAMSGAVAILGAIGPLAASAVAGATSLVAVVGILTAAVAAFGAISQIPGADWLVSEGGDFLQKIGTAIGQFIGGITGGIAEGATSTLPQVATNLSDFIANLKPFIDGVSGIDPASMEGVKSLAETILILTGADLIDSITSWLTGGASLSEFANQLIPFGAGMKSYSEQVAGINIEAITASATAAKGLAEVANAIPAEGGLWGLIAGDKNLGQFASYLIPFGAGMKSYSEQVAGVNTEAITASATAAKGLAEVANAIPAEGGLWGLIAGDKDLGQFAAQLIKFGRGMKSYSEQVSGIDAEAITGSVSAAKGLVTIANSIPTDGGLWSLIAGGDKDLGSFSDQLLKLGKGMSDYSAAVAGINLEAITSSISCAFSFKNLASGLVDFDYSGIDNFKITSLSDKLKTYSDSISGLNLANITTSITAIRNLAGLINGMAGINTSGIEPFKKAISDLGTVDLTSVSQKFSGAVPQFTSLGFNLVNAISRGMASASGSIVAIASHIMTILVSSIQSGQARCQAMGASIIRGLTSGMAASSGALISMLTSLVSRMISSIQSRAAQFRTIGTMLMTNFKMGLTIGMHGVQSSIRTALNNCVKAIKTFRSSFSSAGNYLGQGLINGINSKQQAVYDAGYKLGQKAVQGEKDGQASKSPSKLTIKAGKWLGEGLVIGMNKMGNAVYNAGKSMGSGAVGGISEALDNTRSLISNISDATPTVSPVVDMSNTKYRMAELRFGANIGSLVSQPVNSLAGIVSNAQAEINASNAEVVSAVNGLRDDLNFMYESDDQEIALYVDAKKLASSIAKPMNRQLNLISKREGGF